MGLVSLYYILMLKQALLMLTTPQLASFPTMINRLNIYRSGSDLSVKNAMKKKQRKQKDGWKCQKRKYRYSVDASSRR